MRNPVAERLGVRAPGEAGAPDPAGRGSDGWVCPGSRAGIPPLRPRPAPLASAAPPANAATWRANPRGSVSAT